LALTIWGLTDVRNRGRIDPTTRWLIRRISLATPKRGGFFDGRNPYDVANPAAGDISIRAVSILLLPLSARHAMAIGRLVFHFLAVCVGCWREGVRICGKL